MPSPSNIPAMGVAGPINVVSTTEIVAVTSAPINTDNLETAVNIIACIDFLNSSSGTTATVKIERGIAIAGTPITSGGTWGPVALTASVRSQMIAMGVDNPGQVGGQQYVATVTVAGNSGTPVIEKATILAIPAALS